MLKENPVLSGQNDLFQARLDQIIDMKHELAKMAGLERALQTTATFPRDGEDPT